MSDDFDVIIVGGGLSGLVCARNLCTAGFSCQVLEASDDIGGRIRTDTIDGFLLDRGFQVFLTAYPEAAAILDFDRLQLCRFEPGALVRHGGRFHRVSDPWKRPQHALSTALSPTMTLTDKLRIAAFRTHTTKSDLSVLIEREERATLTMLRSRGFSETIIERFLRPFLGGVFLDRELRTSSRMCEFVFRMFSLGDAALPAAGMQEIPRQLASNLPSDVIRTNARVETIEQQRVVLATGEQLSARAIVVATEAPSAYGLIGDSHSPRGQSVRCLYFAAPEPPVAEPTLVLNGGGTGPINNLCVPSQVSPKYAPEGQSLVSVTVLSNANQEADQNSIRQQLKSWYGSSVDNWRHLKTYDIKYALPRNELATPSPVAKPAVVREGLFLCGDHCDTASINGAMASGRRAAEAVVAAQPKMTPG